MKFRDFQIILKLRNLMYLHLSVQTFFDHYQIILPFPSKDRSFFYSQGSGAAVYLLNFLFPCAQVEDKLPHLKAIIQYKDALKEKRPNLYTVGVDEMHEKQDFLRSRSII